MRVLYLTKAGNLISTSIIESRESKLEDKLVWAIVLDEMAVAEIYY